MFWNRRYLKIFGAVGFIIPLLIFAGPVKAQSEVEQAIDQFVAHVDAQTEISEELRDKAKEVVAEMRTDDYLRRDCMIEGLCALYPEFGTALVDLGGDNFVEAIASLSEMMSHADPYLKAHAHYFTARTLMVEDRYEAAWLHLTMIIHEENQHILTGGESQFLQGVCLASLLRRDEAQEAFDSFLANYPDASERLRVGAWRQIEQLKVLADGSLQDVQERMQFVRRRLGLEDTGENTQGAQQEIVDMLAKLIEEAEKS